SSQLPASAQRQVAGGGRTVRYRVKGSNTGCQLNIAGGTSARVPQNSGFPCEFGQQSRREFSTVGGRRWGSVAFGQVGNPGSQSAGQFPDDLRFRVILCGGPRQCHLKPQQ